MDINLPGKDLAHLHEAALSLGAGGVGYYPASNFIHMDTGPVRRWG
ncbi:MAG: YcbK family protein [Asticcacaulis sp.]